MTRSTWQTAALLVTGLLMASCANMPISSMWKLRNLDVLTTDPEQIRIAVITDQLVQFRDGSATIKIGFSSPQQQQSFATDLVARIDRNAMPRNLPATPEPNESISVFYLSNEEAQELRLAQGRILAIRDQEIEGDGSLSVNIRTGCFRSPPPASLPTDIYMQFDASQGFIKMQSGIDLIQMAREAEHDFWVECDD